MKLSANAVIRPLVVFVVLAFSGVEMNTRLAANAGEWSAQQKEVWKNVETYWALDAAGDTQGFLSYFHSDYQGWNYNTTIPGSKDRAMKFISHAHKAAKTLVYDLQPVTVRVHGNIAYANYYWTRIVRDAEGKQKRESGRWTDILMKEGNKWLMIADHGGEISPKS